MRTRWHMNGDHQLLIIFRIYIFIIYAPYDDLLTLFINFMVFVCVFLKYLFVLNCFKFYINITKIYYLYLINFRIINGNLYIKTSEQVYWLTLFFLALYPTCRNFSAKHRSIYLVFKVIQITLHKNAHECCAHATNYNHVLRPPPTPKQNSLNHCRHVFWIDYLRIGVAI